MKKIYTLAPLILDELKKLGDENKNVHLIKMDVTDIPSYPAIVKQVYSVHFLFKGIDKRFCKIVKIMFF